MAGSMVIRASRNLKTHILHRSNTNHTTMAETGRRVMES